VVVSKPHTASTRQLRPGFVEAGHKKFSRMFIGGPLKATFGDGSRRSATFTSKGRQTLTLQRNIAMQRQAENVCNPSTSCATPLPRF
jgi:hypothetical protein